MAAKGVGTGGEGERVEGSEWTDDGMFVDESASNLYTETSGALSTGPRWQMAGSMRGAADGAGGEGWTLAAPGCGGAEFGGPETARCDGIGDRAANLGAAGEDLDRSRTSARVREVLKPVKEFWGWRADAAFPSPEKASAAVKGLILEGWAGLRELRFAPQEVRKGVRIPGMSMEAAPPPSLTGMVRVSRMPFSGWEAAGLAKIMPSAWPYRAGIEHCSLVKSFGAKCTHAKELNWWVT